MKRKEELKKLLIVVDMINGFIKEGNMSDSTINHITPRIKELVEKYICENEGVAFIKDTHTKESTEFNKYPVHCLKGTTECELIDELKEYERGCLCYEKNSTSTIYAEKFLRDIELMENLEEIIITGCCTDICILNLALPLSNYFDEKNKIIDIKVPRNVVETFDSQTHKREEYNEMALKLMKNSKIGVENI